MLDRKTLRIFYRNPYQSACSATVVRVGPDHVELDQTVAYPEGGGQESDQGTIVFEHGVTLRYVHAKKMYGMPARLENCPDVLVGGVIWHMIAPSDQPFLSTVCVGMQVRVDIDVPRRAWLALSHTASHLLYLGIGAHRPDAIASTLGCHIKTDGARFDFGIENRFEPREIGAITESANELVRRGLDIDVYPDANFPDARYWRCDGQVIPCGGMHLTNTAAVGELRVKRKSLGTSKERLSCEFPAAKINLSRYDPIEIYGVGDELR